MKADKHILIFSHGFGVRKDDRGLLTDIASEFPQLESILFDYFEVDEDKKTLTVRPLSVQAEMLARVIDRAKAENPGAIMDLICHSQGTMVAAMAKPTGIRKTIFLAPVFDMTLERSLQRYGPYINLEGISKLPGVDGLIRLVPPEYWAERTDMQPIEEYNKLAEKTELIAIEANQDELLPKVDLTKLSPKVKLVPLDGDHNFNGDARQPLKIALARLLL